MKKKVAEASRFQYEKAEEILDSWLAKVSLREKAQLVRAYRKMKFMVAAYAHCDYSHYEGVTKEQAMAWAWEDLEIAFRGYGEAAMTGPILQLWTILGKTSKASKSFKVALEKAFQAANDATPMDVPRRYLSDYREKPMRVGEDDFLLPSILPNWGPTLREWAEVNGEDPDVQEDYYFWVEQADRALQEEAKAVAAPTEKEPEVKKEERKAIFQVIAGDKSLERLKEIQERIDEKRKR